MVAGSQGLFVFGSIAIISAIGWHIMVKRYVYAILGATLTTVIIFQTANYIHLGYLDPFFVIAMVVSGIGAFIISSIVGAPLITIRRKQHDKSRKRISNIQHGMSNGQVKEL